jgi:hypothetical protein
MTKPTAVQSLLHDLFGWVSASWVIPAIALVVTVDQWVAATGQADPYQFDLAGKPFSPMAAARGIAIMLSVSYVLRQVRSLFKRANKADGRVLTVLSVLVGAMLFMEMSVITPWMVTAMGKSDMAVMLFAFEPWGVPIGKGIFVIWAMFVATISLLAVGTASLVTFVDDRERLGTRAVRTSIGATTMSQTEPVSQGQEPEHVLTVPTVVQGLSKSDRQRAIWEENEQRNGKGPMTVADIMQTFGVSEKTAIRDLKELGDNGAKVGATREPLQ